PCPYTTLFRSPAQSERSSGQSVTRLFQIPVSDRLASIRRFLGLLYGLLEFLFQQVGSVFLGLHRLPENGVSPAVLLFHRLRGSFNIGESLGMRRSRVRDDRLGSRVHLQDRIAAGE